MKRVLVFILSLMMVLPLCACGSGGSETTKTDYFTLDTICVDDSFRDGDNSSLRRVYLYYTFSPNGKNLDIDSKYTKLKFGGNSYESEVYTGACKYTPSYYYSEYIEDVYIGETLKVVATFKIPEAELTSGATITVDDSQIPQSNKLRFTTDKIVHYNGIEEIGKAIDPTGYANEMEKREDADLATAELVKSYLNGYYWDFISGNISYTIEFYAENNFMISSMGLENTGTYTVQKGYIFCTYPSNNRTVEIPYELVDGDIDLDVCSAFDYNEG